MMLNTLRIGILCGSTVWLTSCGGGGPDQGSNLLTADSVSSAVNSATQQQSHFPGVYSGQASNGFFYRTLVLEDLDHWAVYGLESNGSIYLHGLVQGFNAQKTPTQFTSQAFYYPAGGEVMNAVVTGPNQTGMSFNGVVDTSIQKINFNTLQLSPDRYNYEIPAKLSELSGTWPVLSLEGKTGILTVGTSGALTANVAGCQMQGQISPGIQGKNSFSVTVNTFGIPCFHPFTQYLGDAVRYATNTGSVLMLFGANAGNNQGMVLLGSR